jgi:hypothetical protein
MDFLAGRRSRGFPSKAKAGKMLADDSAQGRPLTTKQKGLFGVIAGGGTPTRVGGAGRRLGRAGRAGLASVGRKSGL